MRSDPPLPYGHTSARAAEVEVIARCAAAARGDAVRPEGAEEASLFRLAAGLIDGEPARRLAHLAAEYFDAHPEAALVELGALFNAGWFAGLSRFRERLKRQLDAGNGA